MRPASPAAAEPILRVEGLTTQFRTRQGRFRAVDDLSYTLAAGETLGLVGESGCGKSVSALSILGLVPTPPGEIVAGVVELSGRDLLRLSEPELEEVRGNRIAMIFQEPMTSLNPAMTIGRQIGEPLERHRGLSRRAAQERAVELLEQVGVALARRRARAYPHQLSGGMRQRAMIAMALACEPMVLLADEPTTALDVTIQAQILELMQDLQDRTGTAIVLITHDLGVIAEMARRVVVMYAGRKVEEAPVEALFGQPLHPYTRGLLASVPRVDQIGSAVGQQRLAEIPGMVPALNALPRGCAFAPRCALATARCLAEAPALELLAPGHWVACFEAARGSA